MTDWKNEYTALAESAGLIDLSTRTRLEITGADRAKVIHNLCTNDVLGLSPGNGCEAFFTDVRGKTIGHGFVFCGEESLVIDTTENQAESLLPHLDRYVIREEVQMRGATGETHEWLLAGPAAAELLQQVFSMAPPATRLSHGELSAPVAVWVARVDLTGPDGFLLRFTPNDSAAILDRLREGGAVVASQQAFDAARIEAGTPLFGRDITADNLPQEVNRDRLAINFTKGCYLGQETVARIDALGHVNRLLCGLRIEADETPPPGTEISAAEKVVGRVTSSAYSPRLASPLALAYLRRGHHTPGSRLATPVGDGEVVSLPV